MSRARRAQVAAPPAALNSSSPRIRETGALLVVALVAFGGVLSGKFLFDDLLLFQASYVRYWWMVWWPELTRPLTWFTLWLNRWANGTDPMPYHAVSLALHLAAVLLLRDVLEKLVSKRAALVGAAIFAVHPIQTEAVAYVYSRAIVLATVLSLVALGRWVRGQRWMAVAWFFAAMLAKEEVAAIPVFLLLLHFSTTRDPRDRKPLAAMFAIALLIGLRTAYAANTVPSSNAGAHAGISAWAYLTAQGPVILRYLRMLVLPWGFTIDPEIDVRSGWLAWLAWASLAAIAAASLKWFTQARAGFWFLGGLVLLLPSSSIFPAVDLAADRRMYLPMIAFSACVGVLLERRSVWGSGLLVGVLMILAMRYTVIWQTPVSVWKNAIAHAPNKVRPRIQLSRLVDQNSAVVLLTEASRLDPNDPMIPDEEARLYLSIRRPDLALEAFKKSVVLKPGDPVALSNRGSAYLAVGEETAARADLYAALKINPCLVQARQNLANIGAPVPSPTGCRFDWDTENLLKSVGGL